MRLLAVHADRLAFEAVQPAGEGDAAAPEDAPAAEEFGECVAAFVAVERGDRADLDAVAADAAAALSGVADRLGADRIAVIPREHLVDDPASAAVATGALRTLAERVGGDREVLRAPVGWHLAVDCERKGHPFAEQARRIQPRRRDGDRTENGTVDALAELGLAGLDPAADGDAVRWRPRGQFLRDAIGEYGERLVADAGAISVSTPAIDVHAAAERRGDAGGEGPIVGPADGDDQLLRPELHGGLLFALAEYEGGESPVRIADAVRWTVEPAANASANPVRRHVRPEFHAVAADEAAAIEEFERLAAISGDAAAALGATGSPVLELAEEFRDEHPALADRIAAALDESASIETRSDADRYWAARLSFVATDGSDRRFGSVELDAETPIRFDVATDDGEGPVFVHAAPVGDAEGAIAALAARSAASERTGLPLWLAPTQVRLVPIDDRHVEYCDDAAARLRAAGVRADVDAREATVGARLARAERERVPFVAAVGDRELGGGAIPVTVLETGREERKTVEELRERVLAASDGHRVPAGALPVRVGDYPPLGGE